MARCEDCLHYKVCLNIESQHLRIILAGNKADERCKLFKPTADVVPKSEVDGLNAVMKEMDEQRAYTINMLGENLENAKAEEERLHIEIEALKIANEKMHSANKAQEAETENWKAEAESWHRTADLYAKRLVENKVKVTEEYRQRVNTKMGKHTHLLGKEYVQRILREVAKEMKNDH